MSDKIKRYDFRITTPPSVNATYKSGYNPKTGKSFFYMDPKAHQVKRLLIKEIQAYASMNGCPNFVGKIIIAELIPVNFRKGRDINNIHKLLWDAFEDAKIIDNDSNIIERPMYKKYTDEKDCYLEISLYEAIGSPTIGDINRYFFWYNDDKNDILSKMIKKIATPKKPKGSKKFKDLK